MGVLVLLAIVVEDVGVDDDEGTNELLVLEFICFKTVLPVRGWLRVAFKMLLLKFELFGFLEVLFKFKQGLGGMGVVLIELDDDDDKEVGIVAKVLDAVMVDAVCAMLIGLPRDGTAVLNSPPIEQEVAVCNEDANVVLLEEELEEEGGGVAKHVARDLFSSFWATSSVWVWLVTS